MLIVGLGSAHLVEWQRQAQHSVIDVGNQASPQMVFFGVEYQARDLSSFVVPIELFCGYFFLSSRWRWWGRASNSAARSPAAQSPRGLHR